MLGVEVARTSNIRKNKVWTNGSRGFVNMKVQPGSVFFFCPLPHVSIVNLEEFWRPVLQTYKIPVIRGPIRVLG